MAGKIEQSKSLPDDMTEEKLEKTLYPCFHALACILAEDYRRTMDVEGNKNTASILDKHG